jgi:hypothetical protein
VFFVRFSGGRYEKRLKWNLSAAVDGI